MSIDLVEHTKKSLENANNNISKCNSDVLKLEGMSGNKIRHFYNNIANMPDCRYLEIGTWKGSSTCSALCNNKIKMTAVDNWSQFKGPKDEFLVNIEKFRGENDFNFIETDCFTIDVSTLPKYNIFMYDGEHSMVNQERALTYFRNCLDDVFVYICDDWNWEEVRQGTRNGIKNGGYEILFENEIYKNMKKGVSDHDKLGYWNGFYIAVLKKL